MSNGQLWQKVPPTPFAGYRPVDRTRSEQKLAYIHKKGALAAQIGRSFTIGTILY